MFNAKKLFGGGGGKTDMTSLNLESPRPSSDEKVGPRSQVTTQDNQLPSAKHPAQIEVNRLVTQLLEADKFPDAFYFAFDTGGAVIIMATPNPPHKSILLFSSPFSALDYLRANKFAGKVVGFKTDSLPALAEQWRNAGIDSFIVNRCPRCSSINILSPKDQLITREQLFLGWATQWALRNVRGEDLVRQYQAHSGNDMVAKKRATLEYLRDHVDYSIPYVHWIIALLAGMQGDENVRLTAAAKLEEFGQEFIGKTTPAKEKEDLETWGRSAVEAELGLRASFGMLSSLQNPPVT